MNFKVKKTHSETLPIYTPDIDIDVDGTRRDEIIDYLVDKYGQNQVCYVGVRGEYKPKSVIRDLGQVYQIPSSETIKCTKEYNDTLTVEDNCKINSNIRKFFEKYPQLKDKVDKISGTISNLGIHPGGVIITDKKYPVTQYCALQKPKDDGRIATLWDKEEIEELGFVKYDILGTNSSAKIHLARKMLGLDPYDDAPHDPEVYRNIVMTGKNKNIFQFESILGQKAFEDLLPTSIIELSNANAILRVIGTAQGRELYNTYKDTISQIQQGDVDSWKDKLRDEVNDDEIFEISCRVLHESYGVLIFQEQLADLVSQISKGEISFGQGEMLRRDLHKMSRKYGNLDDIQGNEELLKKWHKEFMVHLEKYLLPYLPESEKNTNEIRAFIEGKLNKKKHLIAPKSGVISWFISSAAYLFNKAHAIFYSINGYNMMWLKHYHPLEFWVASLNLDGTSMDKVKAHITAINAETDIEVLPPSVNESNLEFTGFTKKGKMYIRYGLMGMHGMGNSGQAIITEREENGKFKNPKDFYERMKGTRITKKHIYGLIVVNGFTDFGGQRDVEDMFNVLINPRRKAGKDMDPVPTDNKEKAVIESKLLGVNISFTHPIMKNAGLYQPVDEIDDGGMGVVAFRLLKTYMKKTKNDKPFKMYRVECLNSGKVVNIFDWQNREDIVDEYMTARITNRNGFFQMNGPSQKHRKFSNRTRRTARNIITR